MPTWLTALFKPLADIYVSRQNRKVAQQTAKTKIQLAKQEDQNQLEMNKDEWEQLQVIGMDTTWKDEYVTVSVMSIFNLVLAGGILTAFGYPQVLEGVVIGVTALVTVGVDVGFLISAAASRSTCQRSSSARRGTPTSSRSPFM